ncbi:hypothetical protein VH570_06505 [Sphingobium sp. HT1-2]|jgi:hypothetical protein|uniref:hypothetical protein n=1 Tax=Sphingobium sp. HT1-2 TaxID=3111640 RepID=UPI003C001F98
MSAVKCLDIIREKGSALSADDFREIQYLITDIPIDDLADTTPWIYEAIHMIIADPLYEGDLTLADIEEDA